MDGGGVTREYFRYLRVIPSTPIRSSPNSLSVPFPNLRSENSTESLIQIIRLGEQWLSRSPLYDVNINQLSDEYVTVFGCLANVKLKAWIDQESRKVIVTGIADSKVALGMLAYIAEVILSVIIRSHFRHVICCRESKPSRQTRS